MQTNCVPFEYSYSFNYFWEKLFFHFLYYIRTCILSYISYLFLREKKSENLFFHFLYLITYPILYKFPGKHLFIFYAIFVQIYSLTYYIYSWEKIIWNIFFHFLYHITYYIYPMPISWKISLLQMFMWISLLHIWCKSWRTSFTYLRIISFIYSKSFFCNFFLTIELHHIIVVHLPLLIHLFDDGVNICIHFGSYFSSF